MWTCLDVRHIFFQLKNSVNVEKQIRIYLEDTGKNLSILLQYFNTKIKNKPVVLHVLETLKQKRRK